MDYFRIKKSDNDEYYMFFYGYPRSIYYSGSKPNFFKEINADPLEFVEKANALFEKHQITIPRDYTEKCFMVEESGKKMSSFPMDFLLCIHCCLVLEIFDKFCQFQSIGIPFACLSLYPIISYIYSFYLIFYGFGILFASICNRVLSILTINL